MKELEFKELFYEFLGVFSLCYFGGWSVILFNNDMLDLLGVAIVHFLILVCFIICSVSDSHFNPSVTITFFLLKFINLQKFVFYILSQFIGSILAGIFLYYTVPYFMILKSKEHNSILGGPHYDFKYNFVIGMIFEFVSTFFLIISVLYNAVIKKNSISIVAISVGSVVCLSIYTFGSITGASINIFRYIGPAIVSLKLKDFFIYIFPAILSSIASKFFYNLIQKFN